jgi:hypothetical protein
MRDAGRPPVPPVPSRWRYQPVASALWRAPYMDGPTLAMRAVDLACSGNIKAIGLIADRLEGRVGIRPGDTDPQADAVREGVQQAIEDVVKAFTEAKLAQADDSTADDLLGDSATPVSPVVIDVEAPR